jgi:uncharacterized protein (DUF4415 family)
MLPHTAPDLLPIDDLGKLDSDDSGLAWIHGQLPAIDADFLDAEGRANVAASLPPLTDDQLTQITQLRKPRNRVAVSVRLDPRVIAWLKSKGDGYLSRINDILINLMEAEQQAAAKPPE